MPACRAGTYTTGGKNMVTQETLDTMVAYHEQGMHVQEIAARLLLDVATVKEALEAHIRKQRSHKAAEEQYGFILSALREEARLVQGHLEELFADRQFGAYNTAYGNWLDTMRLYAELMREYSASRGAEDQED